MLKKTLILVALVSLAASFTGSAPGMTRAAIVVGSAPVPEALAANLLTNGYMDSGFYWRPTNHFVANGWYQWWYQSEIPEFIDGGHPYHNECYPPVAGLCADAGNRSQGYIRMGPAVIAGVYQPVAVAACATYRFEAYNRNDDSTSRPKVGIEPTGWINPRPYYDAPPRNCPPDGNSVCHNPSLESIPDSIVWSPEFPHAPYTWAGQSVTAEALSSTITVFTYVAAPPGSISAYWDYASLVQVPPANGKLIADGALPAADGRITGVTTQTTSTRAELAWTTNQTAIDQVLFHYVGDADMASPPPIAGNVSDYEIATSISSTSVQNHRVKMSNLRPMSLYDFVLLSRQPVGSACQTSVYVGRLQTSDKLVPDGPLPPSTGITGPIILPETGHAYVIWLSAQPSFGQVFYTPLTVTAPFSNVVYLPIINNSVATGNGATSDYQYRTPIDSTLTTLHVVTITANLVPNTLYAAQAVSAWNEGDLDKAAASVRATFQTKPSTILSTANATWEQLVKRLEACLADGQALMTCAETLSR